MDNTSAEDQETIREFLVESHENLSRLDQDLVELEKHPHDDALWATKAALLGLTDEAARILNKKCANSREGYRWPATWGPNFDWLPDQNHGGNLLETTQLMLLQSDGEKIRLLPAWPKQ